MSIKIRTRIDILTFIFLISYLSTISASLNRGKGTLHVFSSEKKSDIIGIINKQCNVKLYRYSEMVTALEKTDIGDGVLILSGNYPAETVEMKDEVFRLINEKKLHAFIEYPSYIPGIDFGDIIKPLEQRAVVSSDFFSNMPDRLNILGINGLHYITTKTKIELPYIVAARVAGFDSAIYGLPENTDPLLFEIPNSQILVSTTRLSNFVSGRFAPQQAWSAIWKRILEYVLPEKKIENLVWNPEVTVTYLNEERLPRDFQKMSIKNGIDWYKNAKILIADSFADSLQNLINSGTERIQWSKDIPLGDGSKGSLECVFSEIMRTAVNRSESSYAVIV